jgi:hypothetical protein
MINRYFHQLFVCSLLLFSCTTKEETNIPTSTHVISDSIITEIPDVDKKQTVLLNFEDFNVVFTDFSIYDEPFKSGDTLIINEEIGFGLQSSLMKIEPLNKDLKYEVYIMFEHNVILHIDEKKDMDLEKWKNKSEFSLINDSSDYYHIPFYDQDPLKLMIQKDILTIKEIALKQKGEYITKDLDTVSTISNLPLEIWVGKTIIKIIQIDKQGKRITKYILNNSSYDC